VKLLTYCRNSAKLLNPKRNLVRLLDQYRNQRVLDLEALQLVSFGEWGRDTPGDIIVVAQKMLRVHWKYFICLSLQHHSQPSLINRGLKVEVIIYMSTESAREKQSSNTTAKRQAIRSCHRL